MLGKWKLKSGNFGIRKQTDIMTSTTCKVNVCKFTGLLILLLSSVIFQDVLDANLLEKLKELGLPEKVSWEFISISICFNFSFPAGKFAKKQCGEVYFWLYVTAYWMPIQQKLTPPVLLFSDFAGWVIEQVFHAIFWWAEHGIKNHQCPQ